MKKAKKIAKRLRARAADLHQMAHYPKGDQVAVDPTLLLISEVLQEVAEQVSPRPKQKATKKAKKAKKVDAKKESKQSKQSTNNGATNNGATNAPSAVLAEIGAGG